MKEIKEIELMLAMLALTQYKLKNTLNDGFKALDGTLIGSEGVSTPSTKKN